MFFTIASLLVIIFFSEMLPKSLAVISPVKVLRCRVLTPFQLVAHFFRLTSNQLADRSFSRLSLKKKLVLVTLKER